jgi:hypothetical protein
MDDQASTVEKTLKPITEQELRNLGATSDASGVWTFRDGSRGKFTERPIAVYSDEKMTARLGFAYFERIERVQ